MTGTEVVTRPDCVNILALETPTLSNTPLREDEHRVHESGIATVPGAFTTAPPAGPKVVDQSHRSAWPARGGRA